MERGRFYYLAFFAPMLILACCSKLPEKESSSSLHIDSLKTPQKIFSLTPSINEILYDLIDEDRILARTPYDSFPTSILSKPVINNFPPDFEKIVSYSPDLILAKEGMFNKDDLDRIKLLGLPLIVQRYESLVDIYTNLQDLGKILDCQSKADSMVKALKYQVQSIQKSTINHEKPTVLILISLEPLYVYGKNSFVNDLIDVAGGKNAMTELLSSPYPMINREFLLKLDPDIIIGTDISELIKNFPEMNFSKSVKNKKVYNINTDVLSRPGPRVIEGIARINKIIHAGNE